LRVNSVEESSVDLDRPLLEVMRQLKGAQDSRRCFELRDRKRGR